MNIYLISFYLANPYAKNLNKIDNELVYEDLITEPFIKKFEMEHSVNGFFCKIISINKLYV